MVWTYFSASYENYNFGFFFQIPDLKEIILIGFYQSSESLSRFIQNAQQEFNIPIRYKPFLP